MREDFIGELRSQGRMEESCYTSPTTLKHNKIRRLSLQVSEIQPPPLLVNKIRALNAERFKNIGNRLMHAGNSLK